MRKRGAIEKVDIGPATVGVKHLGQGVATRWVMDLARVENADRPRVLKLRKEYSKEDWPELHEQGFMTVDGMGERLDAIENIMRQCVEFIEVEDEHIKDDPVAEICRLGLLEEASVAVLRIQRPSDEDIFTEGSGDVASE